ncbi:MAG: PIN domain-containing protein [Selenomonadaceae bacterium]|nr:PIN domain-containing protein [Selenomonadaceae bacterium]
MTTYALDTNVIVDYLRGNESVENKMIDVYSDGDILALPSIVYYEIIRGFTDSKATRRFNRFQELCKSLKFYFLDRYDMQALNTAAKIYDSLRKTGVLIEDNDIYIAAIAMVNDCTLVTDNIKHFSRIEGLRLVNWKE